MLAYLTIVTTAFAAMAGAPWWVAVVCGCLLALISITEQQKYGAQFEDIGATSILTAAGFASLGNGMVAGGGSFALGRVTGLVWGI